MKFKIVLAVIIIGFIGLVVFASDKKPEGTQHNMDTAVKVGDFSKLVGRPAPDFTLQSLGGQMVSLRSLRGKKVVLFFNEGIMCYPACWNQIAALGTDKSLNSDKVVTASIVTDSSDEWMEAIRKMPALGSEGILLDTQKAASNEYGVLNLPSSMHKGMKPGHTYMIVDEKGIVRYTYDDKNMGIQDKRLISELQKL